MTRADLIALAARVEQAQGPDRELDGLIWDALGLVDEAHYYHWCRMDGRIDLTRADFIRAWAPEFTRSLDAAMTLVPDGHAISLHVDADGSVFAGVMRDDGDGCDNADRCGATPALALTAAALRARAEDLPHG